MSLKIRACNGWIRCTCRSNKFGYFDHFTRRKSIRRVTSGTSTARLAATVVIGIASVVAVVWFAGKVFRVGLLMYGKAPNFAALIRWVRMP